MSYILTGLNEIDRCFKKIKKGMKSRDLNIERSKGFKKHAIKAVKSGGAYLLKIRPATKRIDGDHNPEWKSGALLKAMKVKGSNDGSAEVGYFSQDSSKIGESKLTTYQIALLQHTGYRIPLSGEKGLRVRKFLAVHGIFIKKSKTFLHVRPRPFLFMSEISYRTKKTDERIAVKFMNNIINKL